MFTFLFKSFTESESKKTQREPAKARCFMVFRSPGYTNTPYPIQKLFDGELNVSISKQLDDRFGHKFYNTIEEAAQSLYAKTRPGNDKAAYIVELGVDVEKAKHFIRHKQLNSIILKAINYIDLKTNEINSEHKIEVIENPHFNSVLQPNSEPQSRPALAIYSKLPVGDAQVHREIENLPA